MTAATSGSAPLRRRRASQHSSVADIAQRLTCLQISAATARNEPKRSHRDDDSVEIAGAGPAGLAAAITLARAGRRVVVHEACNEVGHRFQGDLQGLENWSSEEDVLAQLERLGVATSFELMPCKSGMGYDASGRGYRIRSREALCYLVERGPGPQSLDSAMLAQARALGVEVRFNSRLTKIGRNGIVAIGPQAADAIAAGYHFDTDMRDGFWVICDDAVAPRGYAYLLVMRGRGTVKTCMLAGFEQKALYVERTVTAFERLAGLTMRNPRAHGGIGNFRIPASAYSGAHPTAGEQAGFQDALWGFGMRYAIVSGVLAARSLIEGCDFNALWKRELGSAQRVGFVNRALYDAFGQRGYEWLLRRQERVGDTREFLFRLYRPNWVKLLLLPWARRRFRSKRQDLSCDHVGCICVWCRCGATIHEVRG